MTTYYNDYSNEFQKALRYDKYDRRQFGRVTFHTGYKVDTPGTASDGIVRCHKLALVISSKFWRDVLEFSGNENVDIFVCDYSKEFIEAYVTLFRWFNTMHLRLVSIQASFCCKASIA